jgi:hypothetical protein
LAALIRRDRLEFPTWANGNTAERDVRAGELSLEREVSRIIGGMPSLWVPIEDKAGPESR